MCAIHQYACTLVTTDSILYITLYKTCGSENKISFGTCFNS